MINLKNNLKIVSIIIGTLIGAGFASGKEIYLFFAQYGLYGIIGLLISNFLIGLIIYKTFLIIKKFNITNYSDFLNILFGKNKFKNIFIFFINAFLLFSFFIMICGFNSYFYQEFKIPKVFTCFIICFLSFKIFSKNISNILNINFLLIPFLIFFIIIFGLLDFQNINIINYYLNLENNNLFYCLIKSILYTSYNCLILMPILISLNKFLKNKKQFFTIGLSIFMILFTLSIIIFSFIILIDNAEAIDIPVIFSIKKFSILQQIIYNCIIGIAIFTSAISSGFGFIKNVNLNKIQLFIICSFPILLLNINFSFLLNIIFNIFGYIGLIQIIFILLKNFNKTGINILMF